MNRSPIEDKHVFEGRFALPKGSLNSASSSGSPSIDETLETFKSLKSRMMEIERETNHNLKFARCCVCRHVPRVKGFRMFVCKHLNTYLRRHSEKPRSDNKDWSMAGVPLQSVELVVEESDPEQYELP